MGSLSIWNRRVFGRVERLGVGSGADRVSRPGAFDGIRIFARIRQFLIAGALVIAGPALAQEKMTEGFDRADGALGEEWAGDVDSIRIEGGSAVQVESGRRMVMWNDVDLQSGFQAEVAVTVSARTGVTVVFAGLAFHVLDPQSYHALRFNPAGRVQVSRVEGERTTLLVNEDAAFEFVPERPYRLIVASVGDNTAVARIIDAETDEPVWNSEEIPLGEGAGGGHVGLIAVGEVGPSRIAFDNLEVLNGNGTGTNAPVAQISGKPEQSVPKDAPNIIVFFTDDQGYADLGAQGIRNDIRTPNIDKVAAGGVRFTNGYVAAPVCGPSRAGLISGIYQQRFGVETNNDLPFQFDGVAVPERLRRAGYRTGMAGKLHLPIRGQKGGESPAFWGFEEYSMKAGDFQSAPKRRLMTHNLDGTPRAQPTWEDVEGYRFEVTTDFAVKFIERNREQPFFLYVAYFGPHSPLVATGEYLARFPGTPGEWMPPARRYALAMMSAIDDGVGRIEATLEKLGLADNTLVFYASDNGAPLRGMREVPVSELDYDEWDGSLNHPLLGEKGMLGEGGIRVPFLMKWPARVPAGQVIDEPVITLDIGATALAINNLDYGDLDGRSLMPLVTGETKTLDRNLYWMSGGQTAIRTGQWKLLQSASHGPYLFDLSQPEPERTNLIAEHPDLAATLQSDLDTWIKDVGHRGPPRRALIDFTRRMYDTHYSHAEKSGEKTAGEQ